MSATKLLLDTSSLIEDLTGTAKGKEVQRLTKGAVLFIPSIVVAELTSILLRKGLDAGPAIKKIFSSAYVLDLTSDIAVQAGKLHNELRKKEKDISLADCIVIVHAKKEDAKIITTDTHFKNYKNAIVL